MKRKVSELEGTDLDQAVAISEGAHVSPGLRSWVADHETFDPSENWSLAGHIIERERIFIGHAGNGEWIAATEGRLDGKLVHGRNWAIGPTPLVAAMRAYVFSKSGEEIDLP